MRDNVTDIACTNASPHKRLARPPGADKGGVGAFCVSAVPVCQDPAGTIFAASSPTSTPLRAVKFGDAPCYYAVNGCATMLRT